MLTFPSKAAVGRIMPKEAFYKRLTLSNELKEKFVSDVKRIVMEFKLTPDTLNIEAGGDIAEILVLSIELKKRDFDTRIIEAIARQNAHKLLFLLKYEDQAQMAFYYNKLYLSEWVSLDSLILETQGLKLENIWKGYIEQIALGKAFAKADELSLDEKLERQNSMLKLQKEISKLEKLSFNEKQPVRRFELYQQLQNLKSQLEVLT